MSPSNSSVSTTPALGLKTNKSLASFYHECWELHSGPQACTGRTLSPQPSAHVKYIYYFKRSIDAPLTSRGHSLAWNLSGDSVLQNWPCWGYRMISLITKPPFFISRAELGGVSLGFLVSSHKMEFSEIRQASKAQEEDDGAKETVRGYGQEKGICLHSLGTPLSCLMSMWKDKKIEIPLQEKQRKIREHSTWPKL